MPATLFGEAAVSRSRSGGVVDLIYIFNGTADDDDVMTAVLATAPATHNGLERQANDIQIEPLYVQSDADDGWWTARVPYSVSQWGFQTGTDSFTFDTSGGTFHTTHSREVVNSYAEGAGTPPDIGGANGGPIGHDAGEAIFLGARGGRLPDNTAAITFRFAAGENVDDLMIGDIGPITAEAWHFVDVHYEDVVIGSGADTIIAKQPKYVYVHRVYFKGVFTDLGIG
jgi:hypothetical protein